MRSATSPTGTPPGSSSSPSRRPLSATVVQTDVDFTQAAGQFGAWEGPPGMTFGRRGKPFYQSGPYDNPRKVIETLERTVGPPPAFDYLVASRA
ncbi:hypothetical protein FRAHR75_1580005 [Frankia sp. Hr75.2]|nr:hypothetical protein FRAHR75_1580005 [Frankia sp. Hr75.2]